MTTSLGEENGGLSDVASGPTLETIKLPRGGVVACTSIGPVQLGMPPETIKDSMKLGLPVPRHYIVPSEPFTKTLGANMGVNVAEFEFPAYCNFFFKRQCVNLIVASADVETRIRQVFQETLFGPVELDLSNDFPQSTPPEQFPDLRKELEYFRNVTLEDAVELPPPPASVTTPHLDSFYPPAFGVTVLGNSHGFDPNGKTSGYVLWINHRGIMIDPPPFSSSILSANNIPALMIDGVILTHCHADHDAGTFQKILQEGRVALITTDTIYRSFLRKYSALSGFEPSFLERVLDHRLVRINDVTQIRGAEFRFFYSLHSIPCVGFEVTYGDKKIAFSGDHLNDVDKILQLESEGILSPARAQELLNFPWHCDAILHEAGVPPIHTPLKTLMALDESIRKKVYVVHTAAKDLPDNCGLRGAPEGVHNTITLNVPRLPEHAGALEILDLVRKVDLFAELTLNHAYEILQMARKVEYAKGDIVSKTGSVGDTFYIIIVGEAQAVHSKEQHDGAPSAEPSLAHSPSQDNVNSPKPIARGRDSCTRRRLSMLSLAKQYRPGDYFDLQSLLTPNWLLPYDMIASTKLSLLEFNALDFNWFLRRTSSFERIQQLAQSRLYFSYDIVESNRVFRRLTQAQRTALEIILRPRDVTEGQVLWSIGDRCSSAVIVDKGHFMLKISPSGSTNNGTSPIRNPPGSGQSRSRPSSPGQTLSLIARKSLNRIIPMDLSVVSGGPSGSKAEALQEVMLSHGGFAGDVDRLTCAEDTPHTTSLVCTRAGSVFVIQKHDLQVFLLENPGLLLSLSGKVFAS
ncbi:CGMP-dependent 3',5'-cGMP phosphodiesterase [Phytophthora cinnamomi]|uniref:CGMP-dependent 3',5'-cGMP phosphodiesterase n=1 Tax=Phytophthora cinnamomi TaxID=4785 RepID=UPI0035596403|nr:CGMP-dependent 3',5'-cGMP phosphodiesterase [Phytophthora cinnamomi]